MWYCVYNVILYDGMMPYWQQVLLIAVYCIIHHTHKLTPCRLILTSGFIFDCRKGGLIYISEPDDLWRKNCDEMVIATKCKQVLGFEGFFLGKSFCASIEISIHQSKVYTVNVKPLNSPKLVMWFPLSVLKTGCTGPKIAVTPSKQWYNPCYKLRSFKVYMHTNNA